MKLNKAIIILSILYCNAIYSQWSKDFVDIFPFDTLPQKGNIYKKINIHDDSLLQRESIILLKETVEIYTQDIVLSYIHPNIGQFQKLKNMTFRNVTLNHFPAEFKLLPKLENLYLFNMTGMRIAQLIGVLNPYLHLSNFVALDCDINGVDSLPVFLGEIDTLWLGCDYEFGEPEKIGLNNNNITHLIRILHPKVLGLMYYIPNDFLCDEKINLLGIMLKGSPHIENVFSAERCSIGEIANLVMTYDGGKNILEGKIELPFIKKLTFYLGGYPSDTLSCSFNVPNFTEVELYTGTIVKIEKMGGVRNVQKLCINANYVNNFSGLADFKNVEIVELVVCKTAILPELLTILHSFKKLKKCCIKIEKGNPYIEYFLENKSPKIEVEYIDN